MISRIAIIDDHPAVILGTAAILNAQPGLNVVLSAATVPELLGDPVEVDLVLLDLQLADGSTVTENTSRLTETGVPVLVFTSGDQPELVREAARAGVAGMIRKSELPDSLAAAVHAVLRGETIATPDWAAALDEDREFVRARLSIREAEILALYAAGETAERVAADLFISRETVLDHIRRIRSKYAAVDRPSPTKVDLFRRAIEDGLVRPEQ